MVIGISAVSSILGISKYCTTWVTSAPWHFSKGCYFQVSLFVLLGLLREQYFSPHWEIIYTFLRRIRYGLKDNSVTVKGGDISANIKSPNPVIDISAAAQTLSGVIHYKASKIRGAIWSAFLLGGPSPKSQEESLGRITESLPGWWILSSSLRALEGFSYGNCKNIVPPPGYLVDTTWIHSQCQVLIITVEL